jgi:hypothetical protein
MVLLKQPIDAWNMFEGADMSSMFEWSQFNQPIIEWDVSGASNMAQMFRRSRAFDQPLAEEEPRVP